MKNKAMIEFQGGGGLKKNFVLKDFNLRKVS